MRISTVPIAVLCLSLAATSAPAAPIVDIDSCGQVVPARTRARLVQDLDCTAETSPTFSSVTLGKGARLYLEGHTIAGGNRGVMCLSRCRVEGPGTIERAEYGLSSLKARLIDIRFQLNSKAAIEGDAGVKGSGLHLESNWLGIRSGKTVRIENSQILTTLFEGIDAKRVIVKDSVLSANGTGILARPYVKLLRSTMNNVGGRSGFDIRAGRRPRLVDSSCAAESWDYTTLTTWGVCAGD